MAAVATQVASPGNGSITDGGIRTLISQITHEPPRREDMDRVRTHLHAAGAFL